MLELQIANPDVTGGTVQVSWCVSVDDLKTLSERGTKEPMVVLVVAPNGPGYHIKKEYRVVVPMKDLVAYLEFRCPGPNLIWGFLSYKSKRDAGNYYLSREHGRYNNSILNEDGTGWAYGLSELSEAPLSVDVPAECFAPEPPTWEKAWTNHFFFVKSVDQCHYRRRRLFAYGVQPFIILLDFIGKLATLLVATLLASRSWTIKYLLHPLAYSSFDSIDIVHGGSALIRKIPEDNKVIFYEDITASYLWKKLCLVPLIPIVWIPILLMVLTHHVIALATILASGIGLIALATLMFMVIEHSLFNKIFTYLGSKFAQSEVKSALWYMDKEEMNLIVCSGDRKPLTLKTLPAKHKTFKLKFQDLKSRVCRPFSA